MEDERHESGQVNCSNWVKLWCLQWAARKCSCGAVASLAPWDLSGGWGYRSGAETLALVDQMARIRIQKKQINMSLIPVWYHICQLNGNIFFLYYKPLLLPHLCLIKHKLHFLSFKIKFIRIYLCFSSGRWNSAWIFLWNSCTVYICVVVVLFVVFFFTYITLTRQKNISLQVGWGGGITFRMNRTSILYPFFPLFCLVKSNCRKIVNPPECA